MAAASFKDQGNEEFKKENYLKAAALYTQAIKEDPKNAVLYSNRSAALLKLNKVTKALEDAETCITLKPDWEKGFFRKGAVLEATEKFAEALDVYQHASKLPGGEANKELAHKVRSLSKLTKSKAQQKEETLEASLASAAGPAAAALAKEVAAQALELVAEKGDEFPPGLHFMPGPSAESHEEKETHIQAEHAFASPELYGDFVNSMRGTAERLDATVAIAVVPKAHVGYPQVWNRKGWPAGRGSKGDKGVFFQVEARGGARHAWFVPVLDKAAGKPVALPGDDFLVLQPLLR
ncbi:hypothetical protein HYH03_016598 [Edaphochlamys debaryana]|uniref:Uncharacterized protein n=1 Tax=Edaphochlamys debaryana TaxID=47281 RepID=A0A836BQ08_9CHLO|nr:hypothetical protein HYH03_016598 [Edaphochlamys debaryana]|eukprot:KAG2484645.1 hypothetical protein HYH03_016598 [Edaphochlamys debaryana]